MIYPVPLQKLIDFYKKLPGIGEKNAERMALATIELDLEEIEFHNKVREGYTMLLRKNNNMVKIDASKSINEVFEDVKGIIKEYL